MMSNDPGELDEVIHAIAKVNRLLRQAGEGLASSAGQTHSRRMVLQTLGDGMSVAETARRLGMQRQGVQRIADDLVRDGLARYEENPLHKRAKLLKATPSGLRRLREIERAHAEWVGRVAASTGGADWGATRRDLELLAEALRDAG
ncbi:MarR family transcriptional regulator [Glycomyces sp. A-F 0318]|uniref:MarR family winged helix-turn-helix transcriptional regulator n=1 Tax=Glycomyces amatae TaxID=2881355 RepID=UPI001E54F124|nr:MarR family transcriptional regulator [Glycomyces amatae]MCD0443951.1 MarR family transcriptional regulator [Glycomyces amatae]